MLSDLSRKILSKVAENFRLKMPDNFEPHPDYPNGTEKHPYRKIYGYARVSTDDQDLDLQLRALKEFGCDRIWQEKKSATSKSRYQFTAMMKNLQEGDMIVVWKMDRLARSTIEIHNLMAKMEKKGVDFKSLTQPFDTTSFGKALFGIMAVMAQLERDLISERTKAGIAAKKAQGVQFGRPSDVKGEKKLRILIDIWLCNEPLKAIQAKYRYKSYSIFQSYFPGERTAANAAEADGRAAYINEFCNRIMTVATEEGIEIDAAIEIGKEMGIECNE